MHKPSTYIYSGLIIVFIGFGDDSARLFSNELVLLLGGLALAYGIMLQLKLDKRILSSKPDWEFDVKKLPSKVYLIVGIGLMRLNRFIEFIDQHLELNMTITLVGAVITFYGLNIFFREKRIKRESGNIE